MKTIEKQLPNHPVDRLKHVNGFVVEISKSGYVTVYENGEVRYDFSGKPKSLKRHLRRLRNPRHFMEINRRLNNIYTKQLFSRKYKLHDFKGQRVDVIGRSATEDMCGWDDDRMSVGDIRTIVRINRSLPVVVLDNRCSYHIRDLAIRGRRLEDIAELGGEEAPEVEEMSLEDYDIAEPRSSEPQNAQQPLESQEEDRQQNVDTWADPWSQTTTFVQLNAPSEEECLSEGFESFIRRLY